MNPALVATWDMMRAESGGEHSLELVSLRVELELTHSAYVVRFGDQIADRGSLVATSANGFTLLGTDGPNLGRAIPCIYQIAGDRLRVCYGMDGTAPTAFASPAGSTHYLATYRRKSK